MDNSRRKQPEHERPVADINAMAGIVPALITLHDIEPIRQQVNDLSLAFIAPLGADNNDDHINFRMPGRGLAILA